jgi:hypothetical protein
MTQVRRTITIELEVDLVGTYVPGEAASRDCPATDPIIVDMGVTGIRGERKSYIPGGGTITDDILDEIDPKDMVKELLWSLAYFCHPQAEPLMIDDAIRGINCD